jgi:hypothetical protein
MLVLLRIIFTGAFIYCIIQARDNARTNLASGDLDNALWVALGVVAAIASALAWAPYLGGKVADPLTGGLVNTEVTERKNLLLQLIRWCDKKGHAGWVRRLCFIEAVRAPWLPTAYILGLSHARPGSWLEKVYAREVFKFNNAENCTKAFRALQRHGIDPRPHASADVNIVLMSSERSVSVDPQKLPVPEAPPPPPLERDKRIRIGTT